MKTTKLPLTTEPAIVSNNVLVAGLSLDQAKTTAIVEGKKIAHRYFTDNEYIYYKNGVWFTEDNYQIPTSYWENMDENWQSGWSYVD